MTLETISFILGAILLAVGILGGGIEIKEIKIPKVTRLVRILSACSGLVFILLGLCIAEIIPWGNKRISPMPDLIIESLTHLPKSPTTEDTITFTTVVKNIGSGTADSSTLALKVREDDVQEAFAIPALKPGEKHRIQRLVTISVAQEYRSTATADFKNEVHELDETNNKEIEGYRVVTFASTKLPDLIIESLKHSPETPTTADTITFTVAVKNIGNREAGRSTLELKLGGETSPKTYSIPALKPSETHNVQQSFALSVAQEYRSTATADIKNDVPESDETNNKETDGYRVVRLFKEDCVSFNPRTAEVKQINGRWKIVDGSHMIFDFENKQKEAELALRIIKHYRMNQSCFVGRPDPSFQYMLVSGRPPQGSYPGEDYISFDPSTAEVKQVNGHWKIVDDSHIIFDFGNKQDEAEKALQIIKKHGFTKSCFVGRPDPSFTYLK